MLLVLLIVSVASPNIVNGINNITVELNDEVMNFSQSPIIKDGATLVPLRVIFDSLGAQVKWEESSKTITASRWQRTLILRINDEAATAGSPWEIKYPNFLVEAEFPDCTTGYEWMPLDQVQLHMFNESDESYRMIIMRKISN